MSFGSKVASIFEKLFIVITGLIAIAVIFAAVWVFIIQTRVKPPEWLPQDVEDSIRRVLPTFFTYRPGEEPPPPPKYKGYIEMPQLEAGISNEIGEVEQTIAIKPVLIIDDTKYEASIKKIIFSILRDAMVREMVVTVQRPIAILPSGHFNTPYLEKRLKKALLKVLPPSILLDVRILTLKQSYIIRNNYE